MKTSLLKYQRFASLIFACLILCFEGTSQLNIKIGYSVAYAPAKTNNDLVRMYDDSQFQQYGEDNYNQMGNLGAMNGVNIGFRYALNTSSVELSWESLRKTKKSTAFVAGQPQTQPTAVPYEILYASNNMMFTFENEIGFIGLGSSIGYNVFSIKAPASNGDEKKKIVKDNQFFARFHLALSFTGNSTVSCSLKPFIQVPLSKINFKALADNLEVSGDSYDESLPLFGLSLIFYNGPQ